FTTAMTFVSPASERTRARLARKASRWIVAVAERLKHSLQSADVGFRRVILELDVLAEEGQLDGVDGAVALLADDDFGDALVVGFLVVDLVAIDEQDQVGVLLDRARFAQVAHHRTLVI